METRSCPPFKEDSEPLEIKSQKSNQTTRGQAHRNKVKSSASQLPRVAMLEEDRMR